MLSLRRGSTLPTASTGASEPPLVSIVIPCYRQAGFLPEAVDSALVQEPPVEIVVVDDGNHDPLEIPRSLGARRDRVVLVRLERNGGLAAALNAGVRAATGSLLLPLAADDLLLPAAVRRLRMALAGRPDLAAVGCAARFFGDRSIVWCPSPVWSRRATWPGRLSATSLFRRSAWQAVGGFDTSERFAEEWVLWAQIAEAGGRFGFLRQALMLYRRHALAKSRVGLAQRRAQTARMRARFRLDQASDDPICEEIVLAEGDRIADTGVVPVPRPLSDSLRRALRWLRGGTGDRRVLLEAALLLALSRLALALLPFRWASRAFGRDGREAPPVSSHASRRAARRVAWAVRVAAERLPFEIRCLHQAMAAQIMLRRRGVASTLYLGVARTASPALAAHAWVRAGGQVVAGGGRPREFTVIGRFA